MRPSTMQERLITHTQCLADTVVGQNDCHALLRARSNQTHQTRGRGGIDAGQRLVENQHPRPGDQRAQDFQSPPLATRQLAGANAEPRIELDLFRRARRPAPRRPARRARSS